MSARRIGEERCGSPSGYVRHQRRGEKPCDACTDAKARYDQRRRRAPRSAVMARLASRAQSRAGVDLRRRYPEEYAELYAHHKAELLRELDAELAAGGAA